MSRMFAILTWPFASCGFLSSLCEGAGGRTSRPGRASLRPREPRSKRPAESYPTETAKVLSNTKGSKNTKGTQRSRGFE